MISKNSLLYTFCGIVVLCSSSSWAATVVSTNPVSLTGTNFDYNIIRFYSSTGENNVLASRVGDGLRVDFTGFSATTSGTNAAIDFATGNLGLTVLSHLPVTIGKLDITADGTFSLAAPFNSTGYAGLNIAVPFNITLTAINGNPYLTAPPTVGLSLGVSYTPTGSLTYVDSPGPEFSSGNWKANWNGDVASLFPAIFTSPTMKVTEISLAITPNVTVWSQNGTATVELTDVILQPIPEPSAFSLLGIGTVALLLVRRRKN